MKKQFIDVEKYATDFNIPLAQAHEEIQTWLFEQGYNWVADAYKNSVEFTCSGILELNMDNYFAITRNVFENIDFNDYDEEITFGRCWKVHLTPFANKVVKTEYVEFNGKQYDKRKLEEALKLIEQSS